MAELKTVIQRFSRFLNALPDIVSDVLIDHVLDNFDDQAFNGKAWKPRGDGDGSRSLLVKSGRGRRSIRTRKSKNLVSVTTDLDYMVAHNDGAEITRVITPRMRKFFWAMHFKYEADMDNNLTETYENSKWKWMALKKGAITFTMPQRQYIGDSEELRAKLREAIEIELKEIFNT